MSLARPALAVGLAGAVSRILGYVRDVLLAATFGAGPAVEAFLAALRLPDALRRILSDGGLNGVLTPLYLQLKLRDGDEAAAGFARDCIAGGAIVLALVAGVMALCAGALVALAAPGLGAAPEIAATASRWFAVMTPFMAFTTLASLAGAFLNAERRFLIPALAPAVMNAVLVVAWLLVPAITTTPERMGAIMAAALSAAGAVQLALALGQTGRITAHARLWLAARSREVIGRALRVMAPAMVASAGIPLVGVAGAAVASREQGALVWFYYAERLFGLPLSLGSVVIGSVVLTRLSEGRAMAETTGAPPRDGALDVHLSLALAWGFPAATGLALVAAPAVDVLFRRGAFETADVAATAAILAWLAPGLPAALAARVFQQQLLARGDVWIAALSGAAGIVATAAAAAAAQACWGAPGLGCGVSVGMAVLCLGNCVATAARCGWRPGWRLGRQLALQAGAATVMGCVLALALSWIASRMQHAGDAGRMLSVLALCAGGAATYGLLAWATGALPKPGDDGQLRRRKRT